MGSADAAIENAQPLSPSGTPLPGDIPPYTPVVIMVCRHIVKPSAALPDTHAPGSTGNQAGNDVAGQEPVFANLDRREIPIRYRRHPEVKADHRGSSVRATTQAVSPAVLAHRPLANSHIGAGGVERHLSGACLRCVALVQTIRLTMSDEKLPARHLPADQVGEVPPFLGRDDEIEVVPFAPGGIRCCR